MDKKSRTCGILRGDIRLLRGEQMLIFDPGADAYFRVSPKMIDILGYLSEDIPLEMFREKLEKNGIIVSLKELEEINFFLRQNNLLIPVYGEMSLKKQAVQKNRDKTWLLLFCSSYLFFRLPPWRPEKLFNKIAPYVSFLTSKAMLICLALPALLGYILAIRNTDMIRTSFENSLSWVGLVKYLAAVIFLKLLHEAAHSLAAIHFGCRVRGIGIGFMMFMPRLYTDTTDSYRLERKKRLLIDAAGIIAELLTGGIAALLWINMAPGAAKSTMFYIFAVSTISTLLVNGNPFIRYDGYYILCDLVGIENLMSRAGTCLRNSWRWYFLRIGSAPAERNKTLLLLFGIGSFIYRIFLYTSICLLIYYKFIKTLAIIMLLMEFYALLIAPGIREIRTIFSLSRKSGSKALYFISGFIILCLCIILFLPLSWGINMYGESVPAWCMPITIEESGYLKHDLLHGAKKVKKGDKIISLSSPKLDFAVNKLKKMIAYDELLYRMQSIDEKEFSRRMITEEKTVSDKIALRELERRKKLLDISAADNGYFISDTADMFKGGYLAGNTVIGQIVSDKMMIYAYSNDRDISKIKVGSKGYAYTSDGMNKFAVETVRVEKKSAKLQKSPLLQVFGGPVPVYVNNDGFEAVQAMYRIELKISDGTEVLPGRILKIEITHKARLYKELKSYLLSFFRKEF